MPGPGCCRPRALRSRMLRAGGVPGGVGERGISPLAVCSLLSLDFVRPPGCQMEGGGEVSSAWE